MGSRERYLHGTGRNISREILREFPRARPWKFQLYICCIVFHTVKRIQYGLLSRNFQRKKKRLRFTQQEKYKDVKNTKRPGSCLPRTTDGSVTRFSDGDTRETATLSTSFVQLEAAVRTFMFHRRKKFSSFLLFPSHFIVRPFCSCPLPVVTYTLAHICSTPFFPPPHYVWYMACICIARRPQRALPSSTRIGLGLPTQH